MKFYDGITDFIFVADEPQKSDIIFIPGGSYPEAAEYAAQLYHVGYAPLLLPSGKYSITVGHFVEPREPDWKPQEARGQEARTQEAGIRKTTAQKARIQKELLAEGKNAAAKNIVSAKVQLSLEQKVIGRSCGAEANRDAGPCACQTECDYLCAILSRCGVPRGAVLREDEATFTWENAIFSRRVLEKSGIRVKKAIICCQAFHARRCLMYYQEQFPETAFRVCPVVTRGIARDTWYKSREGIDTVLGEVERCGVQFGEIIAKHAGIF